MPPHSRGVHTNPVFERRALDLPRSPSQFQAGSSKLDLWVLELLPAALSLVRTNVLATMDRLSCKMH